MSERVAFLGLGIMGSRMAANVARAGFDLTVWNRTAATAEAFAAEHGAKLADSPADAAREATIVITMVVDGPQVEEVLLGRAGVAEGAPPHTLCIDCSTIGPAATHEIGAALAARGLTLIDAPVTGSSPKAQDGTLTFMVGSSDEDFARVRPLLEAMGEVIVHAGPQGHGQMVKVISNAVASSNLVVLAQALLVGERVGVNLDALLEVMRTGAGGSTMLTLKARPMREHDFTSLYMTGPSGEEEIRAFFKLDHMLKDVRLCLEQAKAAGISFDYARATEAILEDASDMGHGDHDFSALIDPLERDSGVTLE
jgi:3-hydroxyisobutyrate dehydrogenase-like beta-hydroxyacid dehydrogenase